MTAGPSLELIGYGPSVYTRVVRIVLGHLGLSYGWTEADPFAGDPVPHPMGRVPVLRGGAAVIYETAAISRYLDRRTGGTLTPADPLAAARMDQVIAVVDAYAYWPLVRQVYAHAVYRPSVGAEADPAEVRAGLEAAGPVLAMLEEITAEGLVLDGARTLADCHLAPMLAAFAAAEAGRVALADTPALARWCEGLAGWPAFVETGTSRPLSDP